MGDLSKNFSAQEFACRCGCGLCTVVDELVELLQHIRDYFGREVKLNCGCRCLRHNIDVGGAKKSQHLSGKAADIVVDGVSPSDVALFVSDTYQGKYGVGLYDTFTHVDVRPAPGWREDKRVAVV